MKRIDFNIPIYGFDITLVEVESKEDKDKIKPIMEDFKCSDEDINQTIGQLPTPKGVGL